MRRDMRSLLASQAGPSTDSSRDRRDPRNGPDIWTRCPRCATDSIVPVTWERSNDTVRLSNLVVVTTVCIADRRGDKGRTPRDVKPASLLDANAGRFHRDLERHSVHTSRCAYFRRAKMILGYAGVR